MKQLEFLDGDYTSQNADGSRNLEWGWYPTKAGPDSCNGWEPTGRTRRKNGRFEFEACAGIWFGHEVSRWFFKGDDGKWYHADPPAGL